MKILFVDYTPTVLFNKVVERANELQSYAQAPRADSWKE